MRNLDKLKPILNEYEKGYIIYKDGSLYRTTKLSAGVSKNGRWERRDKLKYPTLMRMALSSGRYYRVNAMGNTAYEHVVIYAIHHGIDSLREWESIDHLDNNKLNNRIENLEGVTVVENNNRIIEDNLLRPPMGEENGASKLTDEMVIRMRKLHSTKLYTQYQLGELFNINQSHVHSIVNRKTWKHI